MTSAQLIEQLQQYLIGKEISYVRTMVFNPFVAFHGSSCHIKLNKKDCENYHTVVLVHKLPNVFSAVYQYAPASNSIASIEFDLQNKEIHLYNNNYADLLRIKLNIEVCELADLIIFTYGQL